MGRRAGGAKKPKPKAPPFAAVPLALLDDARCRALSGADWRVLLALCRHMDPRKGWRCWPQQETIARAAQLKRSDGTPDRQAVQRSIGRIEQAGLLRLHVYRAAGDHVGEELPIRPERPKPPPKGAPKGEAPKEPSRGCRPERELSAAAKQRQGCRMLYALTCGNPAAAPAADSPQQPAAGSPQNQTREQTNEQAAGGAEAAGSLSRPAAPHPRLRNLESML